MYLLFYDSFGVARYIVFNSVTTLIVKKPVIIPYKWNGCTDLAVKNTFKGKTKVLEIQPDPITNGGKTIRDELPKIESCSGMSSDIILHLLMPI